MAEGVGPRRLGRYVADIAGPGAALVVSLLVAGIALWLGGHDPLRAGVALTRGAFGTADAFSSVTLVRAVPFILTGLAVALALSVDVIDVPHYQPSTMMSYSERGQQRGAEHDPYGRI